MTDYLLIVPIIVSFLISLVFMPIWIKKAKQIGLMWQDMNKIKSSKVSGSGGIVTISAFVTGVLLFIAYRTFYVGSQSKLIEILALLTAILFLTGIGLLDDLLGWQKGGLSKRTRLILVALSAIPLVVINAGRSKVSIPLAGIVDLGIIYPLIIIPLGVVGAATTFNFLAGFNGMEAGNGILILFALSVVAFFTGQSWLTVVCLCMAAALAGFLLYNFYPAKVFPGDSLTYAVGGLIAIVAILGNFEKIAVFFFIPYIIEVGLKSRGKLVKHSFGKPSQDGTIDLQYSKIYSLNHLAIFLMKKYNVKATEKKVVLLIWLFQLIIIILGFLIFKEGIFGLE